MLTTPEVPVYTSYYGNKKLYTGEYVIINIARKQPNWVTEPFPTFYDAVPSYLTLSNWYRSNKEENDIAKYISQYYSTTLCAHGESSPSVHTSRLLALTMESKFHHGEKPIVFTCYEAPGKFCHRRVYATYLELISGIIIPELGYDYKNSNSIEEILKKLIKGESL